MSGTAHRRRHGQAGLLVALFVVAGLVFSYGLGHALPDRVCIENGMSVPAEVATAMHHASTSPGGPAAHPAAVHGVPGHAGTAAASLSAPLRLPPLAPADACLCLAVLFALMLLGLATGRRALLRLPARAPRAPAPPPGGVLSPISLASLQVLRL
ncbi:hypothetical protein [Actinomadura verrucosospora]|uniref:Major facilitator transporter n=1 Tax=Actinomadura verrucosospora TaxID=46165 RepID=A0A7D4ACV8_ACTVE|nr:hypothetical protein [Actinomadura verrucosospora]QKG27587.1 major facilitator transporter [Actinomadura verrucosospora]